ncbi:alpha/beta fold hydrolase [Methylobacillus caricis]|uniref:RBBP9/YdeN family alpha/beta hydrolase n=1 Tax=Methylobacillus caricis TaxID=1971611 RepID=UPI001CFFE3AE|nr:alpha/beta fold hydrolase [Methylobacillus caricis]MCB5187004.1 alpha/beta fold hydrolase [Methylobacillus caricis]
MQAKTIYIIHGYQASPQSHWFPWLKQALEQEGATVHVPELPGPNSPKVQGWLEHLQVNIQQHDKHTFFVGHSLGCITLLQHLMSQTTPIGGMVLVSGFAEHLSFLPEVDPFTASPLDFEHLIKLSRHRVVVAAKDDNIVPYPYSLRLSDRLGAEWELFEEGGHFMEQDGFTEFPAIYDVLMRIMSEPA